MKDEKGILLETGTNEFEIIEFTVGTTAYGINVAKVREVINHVEVTKIANSHPCVDGVFSLRGKIMPLVNLAKRLGVEEKLTDQRVIISEINKFYFGFKVDAVTQIHRVSWTMMEPAPHFAGTEMVTGIVKMGERLIILLDFENIISELNPDIASKLAGKVESSTVLHDKRNLKTILVAEDSKMLRDILVSTLIGAGYKVMITENGQQAWDLLNAVANEGNLIEKIQLVITDIEMPQMDGYHLIKRMKEHLMLKELPVIIFSSLINEEMRRKGEALGVVAQVTKPEIVELVGIVDNLIT
jgi:two-component system chemotaxis response regulator CheV